MARAFVALMLWIVSTAALGETEIAALAYHDIVAQKNGDPYAITAAEFQRQLDYLVSAGYHPISLTALERAHNGEQTLPPKPVLLTFDDGYKSYYDIAFPLLQKYGFPSVVSLVTSWTDGRSTPDYASAQFMTWDELRTIIRSPLVEVLSHTDDLHRNVVANAFGARLPSVETRLYNAKTKSYENEDAHRARVRADLERSVKRIKEELGVAPRGITWPYGRYDGPALQVADALGLHVYLTLDTQPTLPSQWPRVNRGTFRTYRKLADLGELLTFQEYRKRQWRFVSIDVAAFANKQPAELAQLIFELGQRIELLRVNAVLVRPFSDDAKQAYFHTEAMPIAADVLGQIAFQLRERAGIRDLIVQVPAGLNPKVCADLARLNWFGSAVIEGDPKSADFRRTAEILRGFKPALKIGTTEATVDDDGSVNFRLIDLPATLPHKELAQRVKEILKTGPRALFKLDRSSSTSAQTLGSEMTVLREAGALHYGYGPDDFLDNSPEFLRIVRPLAEYTIPPARK